jgi:choline transport protein
VAFNDVVSLSIGGLYTSYFIGNTLLLYRRVRGHIRPYSDAPAGVLRNTTNSEYLTWGTWHIPEPLGIIVNAISCAYLFVMFIFSFWPTISNPNPAQMNYSSLMIGAVLMFSIFYYILIGRKTYKGPVVEVEPS